MSLTSYQAAPPCNKGSVVLITEGGAEGLRTMRQLIAHTTSKPTSIMIWLRWDFIFCQAARRPNQEARSSYQVQLS
jgi:hypothetical protein